MLSKQKRPRSQAANLLAFHCSLLTGKSEGAPVAGSAFLVADDKPNSVPPRSPAGLDDHFSRNVFTPRSARAGVRLLPGKCAACAARVRRPGFPVLSCTAWGLSCPAARAAGGGLLPRLFTLTRAFFFREKRGRFVFCDTFRRAELAPGTPAHFTRHAAWMVFGLSSAGLAPGSDHLSAARSFRRSERCGKREWEVNCDW